MPVIQTSVLNQTKMHTNLVPKADLQAESNILVFLQTVKGLLLVFGGVSEPRTHYQCCLNGVKQGEDKISSGPQEREWHKSIIHLVTSFWVACWCLTQPAVFYGTCPQAQHLTQALWPKRKCLVEIQKAKVSSALFLNPAGSTIEPLFWRK